MKLVLPVYFHYSKMCPVENLNCTRGSHCISIGQSWLTSIFFFLILKCILNREVLVNWELSRYLHMLTICTMVVESSNVTVVERDQLKPFTKVTKIWPWSYQTISSLVTRTLSDMLFILPETQQRLILNRCSKISVECTCSGLQCIRGTEKKLIGACLKYKVLEKGSVITTTEIRNEIFSYKESWERKKST